MIPVPYIDEHNSLNTMAFIKYIDKTATHYQYPPSP